jgi:hypothetical protein
MLDRVRHISKNTAADHEYGRGSARLQALKSCWAIFTLKILKKNPPRPTDPSPSAWTSAAAVFMVSRLLKYVPLGSHSCHGEKTSEVDIKLIRNGPLRRFW